MTGARELMRCDLHVHSWYSGPADLPVFNHIGRECYSEPAAVYEQALRRGMDLVTLTDHDSIEGALGHRLAAQHLRERRGDGAPRRWAAASRQRLRHRRRPSTRRIQARRRDAESLFAYLAEQRIPASVNHLFSALTGDRALADLRLPLGRLPLIETLNGSMPELHNEYARRVGRAAGMAPVGGSDSHSLAGVGRAYTTVAGARSKEDFLEGLRRGLTVPSGRSGTYARLTAEVTRIFAAAYRDVAIEAWSGRDAGRALVSPRPAAPAARDPARHRVHSRPRGLLRARHFRAFQKAFGWPAERVRGRGRAGDARALPGPGVNGGR